MKKYELKNKILAIRNNNMFSKLNDEDLKFVWDNCFSFHPNRTTAFDEIEYVMPTINKQMFCSKAFLFVLKDGSSDFWSIDKSLNNVPKTIYEKL